LPFRVV